MREEEGELTRVQVVQK